jgi:hypothetical protein
LMESVTKCMNDHKVVFVQPSSGVEDPGAGEDEQPPVSTAVSSAVVGDTSVPQQPPSSVQNVLPKPALKAKRWQACDPHNNLCDTDLECLRSGANAKTGAPIGFRCLTDGDANWACNKSGGKWNSSTKMCGGMKTGANKLKSWQACDPNNNMCDTGMDCLRSGTHAETGVAHGFRCMTDGGADWACHKAGGKWSSDNKTCDGIL